MPHSSGVLAGARFFKGIEKPVAGDTFEADFSTCGVAHAWNDSHSSATAGTSAMVVRGAILLTRRGKACGECAEEVLSAGKAWDGAAA